MQAMQLNFFAKPDIDGGLVGGASLKPDFGKIVNYNKYFINNNINWGAS